MFSANMGLIRLTDRPLSTASRVGEDQNEDKYALAIGTMLKNCLYCRNVKRFPTGQRLRQRLFFCATTAAYQLTRFHLSL